MSKSVRLRRGSSIDHTQFAGAEAEITVDTTLDTIRVHDGVTLGGFRLLNADKDSNIASEILTANKIYYKNSFASLAQFPSATQYPGMVAYSQAQSRAYVSTGVEWTQLTLPTDLLAYVSDLIPASTDAGDLTLIQSKVGSSAILKTLRTGTNITLAADTTGIRISSASYTGANISSAAGAVGVYASTDSDAHQLKFKSIRAGTGVTVAAAVDGNEINIDTVLKQAFNTVRVGGVDIVTTQSSDRVEFVQGLGIQLTGNATNKTVQVSVALTAASDTDQTGSSVLQSYTEGTFVFNKLQAGAGVQLTTGANGEIVVSAPQVGTVTDGANADPAGVTAIGFFKQKTDSTLEFFNIAAGSNITLEQTGNNIFISSSPGGAAGVGTVQTGIQGNLAFYPSTGTAVGDITDGATWDAINQRIVANIDGTVTSIANHTTDALTEGTNNVYWTPTRFDNAFAAKTTTGLAEGTNLYFTDERAQDAVSTMLVLGNPNSTLVVAQAAAASTSIATIFVTSTAGITQGATVAGTGFPAGVTVQAVGVGSFTVSPAVFCPAGTSITIGGSLVTNASGSATSTAQVSVTDSTNIQTGWYVTGTGVQGRVQVQSIQGNLITLTPGYNSTIALGTTLSFRAVSTNGLLSTYTDGTNTFSYTIDTNYLGDIVRSSFNVPANSGIGYDPVQGRFTLSGAVTSVNGFSGAVQLGVGDISGAAPITSPVFLGTPRAATPTAQSNVLQIANKDYVDAARLAVSGSPLPGLTTLQALGNSLNGDTQFFTTVTNSLSTKLSTAGGTLSGQLILNYLVDSSSNNLVAVNKRYVDGVASVQSVNTKTGNVILFTDDIFERATPAPSNLWFTTTRARQAISLTSDDTDILSYNFNTGAFVFNKPTTDDILEGTTNRYFTGEAVRNSITVNVTGNSAFASYNPLTGQIIINASSDNLSSGTTNRFFTDSLARSAITLATSISQTGLLTYNSGTGQFTIAANTANVPEGAGGPFYFSGARVNSVINTSITQLNTVAAAQVLTTAYNASNGVTTFTFNANTNSITEGNTNQYYLDSRARNAISITSSDTNVLNYDKVTGFITFTKPTTDGIAEGVTNKYFTQALARGSFSTTNTNTQNTGLPFVSYDNSTGLWTFNVNIDSLGDGGTNKFATIGRISSIISLAKTTSDGASPGDLITYVGDASQARFTFNNSTDSLREGSQNKWASATNVRPLISFTASTPATGTTQAPIQFNNTTSTATVNGRINLAGGQVDLGLFVNTSLIWTPTANGTTTFHLATVQDITTTGTPKFKYITKAVNPGQVSGRVSLVNTTEAPIDCSQGAFHEINRTGTVTNMSFTNVPASNNYFEVTVAFYNATGPTGGGSNPTFAISNTAIKWGGTTQPTSLQMSQTIGRRDIFKFYTVDGGTNWYEMHRNLNVG